MVYIEHDTTEPVIEPRGAQRGGVGADRWPTQHGRERRHSPAARWFLFGAVAAAALYVGVLLVGWNAAMQVFNDFSL